MASARERVSGNDDMTEYERQKWAQVARNNEKMESLRLMQLSKEVQSAQQNKRSKRTPSPNDAAIEHHNLRPRPQRNNLQTANEQIIEDTDYEAVGDFLCANEDLHKGAQKRNGRKITTMNDIFSRKPDMPKIKITANKHGQPVGENYRQFVSAIGCEVRKTLPVRFTDWRDIPIKTKDQVWNNLEEYYDLDGGISKWFTDTIATKWRDYKTNLKRKYFDETLTDKQIKESLQNKLNVDDINGLLNFWRSPECQARSERGKANRANLKTHHTSGSISYACRSYNLGKALGRPLEEMKCTSIHIQEKMEYL